MLYTKQLGILFHSKASIVKIGKCAVRQKKS